MATSLLGKPHYELVDRYGYRETLIGRYQTQQEAEAALRARLATQNDGIYHELIIRPRDF